MQFSSDESVVPRESLPTYTGVRAVSPGFFKAMGIRVLEGDEDALARAAPDDEASPIIFVNESLAQALWPDGESVLGKGVTLPNGTEVPFRIAGVVRDFRQQALSYPIQPDVYFPWAYWAPDRMYLVVRVRGDPEDVAPAVQAAVWSVDRDVPISRVRTLEEVVARTLADTRLTTLLLVLFGGMALTLGAVGVYGVASYTVSQNTFEIGLRMALGAGRGSVLAEVLIRFAALAAAGIGLGLVGALGATRVLSGFLYEISATDPRTYVGVALFLILVALLASLVPALRASRVQPATVLKLE